MWNFLEKGEVCINGPGHIPMMAAMPIYGKYLYTFLQNQSEDLEAHAHP